MSQTTNVYDLTNNLIKGVTEKENRARENDYKIYKGPTIKTFIAPTYARYIGKTCTTAFNGNFRKWPVDGTTFEIPLGHYAALRTYIRYIDEQINTASTNVNFMGDQTPGDFKLLR